MDEEPWGALKMYFLEHFIIALEMWLLFHAFNINALGWALENESGEFPIPWGPALA